LTIRFSPLEWGGIPAAAVSFDGAARCVERVDSLMRRKRAARVEQARVDVGF